MTTTEALPHQDFWHSGAPVTPVNERTKGPLYIYYTRGSTTTILYHTTLGPLSLSLVFLAAIVPKLFWRRPNCFGQKQTFWTWFKMWSSVEKNVFLSSPKHFGQVQNSFGSIEGQGIILLHIFYFKVKLFQTVTIHCKYHHIYLPEIKKQGQLVSCVG